MSVIPTLSECPIKVGQVYASTHSGDVEHGSSFVWLQTEGALVNVGPTRVRLRSPKARTIPGHRRVEDAA